MLRHATTNRRSLVCCVIGKPAESKGNPLEMPVFAKEFGWLPDRDLNPNKQIQSLLCYHYTIRQFNDLRHFALDVV